MVPIICTVRFFLVGLVSCLLMVACSDPKNQGEIRGEISSADVSEVAIGSPPTPPLRVRVTFHGALMNGCERLGEVTQRLEGQTFFVKVTKVYKRPVGVSCHTGVTVFKKEVILEVQELVDGVYTVNVNGVTDSFELKGGGIFVESGRASLAAVEAQVLEASPETSSVSIGVFVEGEFGDPCVDMRGVKQVREGNTFKIILETTERIDVACPPVGELFRELVLLEPQSLPPGTYQVEVDASDTMTTSFELRPNAMYREAKVTEVEVVPTESFTADVLVRGERDSCEVIDGALQRQEGTDRDMLPDSEFVISLISRITGMCGNETVLFEEVVPISSYGSGDYTVNVNGVAENFTFPGAAPFTRP